jgi:hypothetical protein
MSPRCFLRRENHFKGEFIVCDLFLLRRKLKYYSTDVKQQSINIGVHQQEYDTDASIRQGLPPDVEQELLTLPENRRSPRILVGDVHL